MTPSRLNPLGIKGAREAGAIAGGGLFARAIDPDLLLEDYFDGSELRC